MILDLRSNPTGIRELLFHFRQSRLDQVAKFRAASGFNTAMPSVVLEDQFGDVLFDTSTASRQYSQSQGPRSTSQWQDNNGNILCFAWYPNESDGGESCRYLQLPIDTVELVATPITLIEFYDTDTTSPVLSVPVGESVKIAAGLNVELGDQSVSVVFGGTPVENSFSIAATPRGVSAVEDCEQPKEVRTINYTHGESGQFFLPADRCYRLEPVVDFHTDGSASIRKGELTIADDCRPCCDCDDYLRTYKAMEQISRQSVLLAETFERDAVAYKEILTQLGPQIERLNDPITLQATSYGNCMVLVYARFINQHKYALRNVKLQVSFESKDTGVWSPTTPTGVPSFFAKSVDKVRKGNFVLEPADEVNAVLLRIGEVAAGEVVVGSFACNVLAMSSVRVGLTQVDNEDVGPAYRVFPHACEYQEQEE